jgi:glycosyltransferase involved in cell wall biosynthesis
MTQTNTPIKFVSVIIPVFNDNERLKICLEALEQQTYPKNLYEVIVVDNGSEEDVKSVVSCFGQASTVYEERPGSYAARNKGISVAKGDILAFTDADCIPVPHWIEKGVEKLQSTPGCGMVAGEVELFFKNPSQPTAVELYESIEMGFPQDKFIEDGHFGVTANIFTFKKVIEDVGSFNDILKSGGDKEWGQRVFLAGYKQLYADEACVYHPTRHSFSQLYKRVTRIDGGKHDLMKSKGFGSELTKELINDVVLAFTPPFRSLFRIWSKEELATPKQKIQFIMVMLFVRYVCAWERIRLKLGGQSRRW